MTEGQLSTALARLRRHSAVAALLVAVISVASPIASSRGVPPEIPGQQGQASCSYRLDPPQRIESSPGVAAVAATIAAAECHGEAQPENVTVCIRGEGLGTQCQNGTGWQRVELTFRPWRPGVVYTATGTGCALAGNPVSRTCTPVGPLAAGL